MAAGAVEAPGRGRSGCFFEVGRREIGSSFPGASSRRISGSEDIVTRMVRYGKLKGHAGCVNTVSFNPSGDLLVSGSDDTNIILWDWLAKAKRLVYPSGHQENVFNARVMPFTDDSTIVTVAADGQVSARESGEEGGTVNPYATQQGLFSPCAMVMNPESAFESNHVNGEVYSFSMPNTIQIGNLYSVGAINRIRD